MWKLKWRNINLKENGIKFDEKQISLKSSIIPLANDLIEELINFKTKNKIPAKEIIFK